jgi:alkylation response protein AidB-like acyl-CoA dehydrogenase
VIRDAETLGLLTDSVRRFVRERLVPAERTVDETGEIPADIVDGMKALGLFGMTIPEAYGGLGLTTEEEVEVVFELTQTSPAFRSLLGTTVGIGSKESHTCDVVFDGVRVLATHLIGDSGIERFHRDVRLFRICEGTTQIQQLVIARHMLRKFRQLNG